MFNKTVSIRTAFNVRLSKNILRQYSTSESTKHYDIVVAGGGMVGTSLASALGRNSRLSDKKILLLEATKEKAYTLPDKYSNRVVSVNPGGKKLLNDINAWKHIENARFATVKKLQVWDALSEASITFGDESDDTDVSYIVENDLLVSSVSKELNSVSNVETLYDAKVKKYKLPEYNEDAVLISLENGNKYSCEILLGCDGANSQIRKEMGVNYIKWNYDQMGVVATLKLNEEIDNNIAWQRFLPTGPIALLPLKSNLSSLVWSTSADHAKELLKMSETDFVDALNKAIWKIYDRDTVVDKATNSFDNLLRLLNCPVDRVRAYPPKIETIEEGSRGAFPLGFGHATSYITKGAVLLGDAAHRIHPLAGQGVNLGFGDVTCLNKILGRAAYDGCRLDNLSYLKEYETERQRHNIPTMLAVEGLHRLYNTESIPVVLLRSLGLQATHALNPLKKLISNQAAA